MKGFIIFIFGTIFGSFLNVVLLRLHQGESIFFPRSYCPHCKKSIFWYDNIPLFSFLALGGRCRFCRQKISLQYPLVELALGIIFLWLYLKFGLTLKFFSLAVFSGFLLIIFVYDFKYYLILDEVIIPAMIVALLFNLYQGLGVWNLILGGAAGLGFFLLQYIVSAGRWIGEGDIWLGGLVGLMLGWQMLLVALFVAYLLGATIGLILIFSGKKAMSSRVPFGPFLSLATFFTFLYGQQFLTWYLNLINF